MCVCVLVCACVCVCLRVSVMLVSLENQHDTVNGGTCNAAMVQGGNGSAV